MAPQLGLGHDDVFSYTTIGIDIAAGGNDINIGAEHGVPSHERDHDCRRRISMRYRSGNADVAEQKQFAEDRVDAHENARLTPKGRIEMVRAVVD